MFKDGDSSQLQSYINTINQIKNAKNTTNSALFNKLQVEEYAVAIEGLESKQAALLLSTQGLTNAQIAETLVAKEGSEGKAYEAMLNAGLLKSKQKLTQEELNSTIATLSHTEAETARIAASITSATATNAEGVATATVTKAKIAEAVQNGVLTESEAQLLSAKLGVIAASEAESASLGGSTILNGIKNTAKAAGKEIKALGKGLFDLAVSHPIITGLTTVVTAGAIAWGTYTKKQKKAAEELEKVKEKAEEAKSNIKSLSDELKSQTKTVNDIKVRVHK